MKTLFLGYHNIKTEARSQEIIEMLMLYGQTTAVSYGAGFSDSGYNSISNKNNKKGIMSFLRNCKKAIDKVQPDIVVLHDDYPLLFVSYIRRKLPKAKIIHDSSELYLVNERIHNTTLKKKIAHVFRYVELINTKKVDVVIAANQERALIMKNYFKLSKVPIVYDNIHMIQTEYDLIRCEEKFGDLFCDNIFTAIYAGGVAEERLTYILAEQFGKLGIDYQLIIVGSPEIGGEEKLRNLLHEKNIKNVAYLGFVSREELKYLMEKSDISISAFALDVVNNINCASGKVYEGLFLGKPLLAGVNPPLKSLCENYKVGISTCDFAQGCKDICQNYDYYKKNVRLFVDGLDYNNRVQQLKSMIDKELDLII